MHFRNRLDAGQALASRLTPYSSRSDVLVLGLPRGGVPVAAEVARALRAPLDVFLVRKLGVPGHEELAMGAIAEGGITVMNDRVLASLDIPSALVERAIAREAVELERRTRRYRGDRPAPDVAGRIVILVDDGLATGSTMEAAVAALRTHAPSRVVVAAPVGAGDTCDRLRGVADEVVCVTTPAEFRAVGQWYDDFSETTDDEVHALIERQGL
jgi:predicted phosphoribosyltransferase